MNKDLIARQTALEIVQTVLYKNQNLDAVFDKKTSDLDTRDRAFVRMLATTTLRRLGQIDDIIARLVPQHLPQSSRPVADILRLGICQILFMQTAEHAAVSTSVEMTKSAKREAFAKLVNAVLRTVCREKENLLNIQDAVRLNTPEWLWQSWVTAYGLENARRIASANLNEPFTYLWAKEDPQKWAEKVGGAVTPTGSIQLGANAYIPELQGFATGDWWVQDAGAALAVQALDNVWDKKAADICAAPGGKTASLIARGAHTDAYDISAKRMERVKENLNRLHYDAPLFVMDANEIKGNKIYDIILIDAPCSATGTIMRHPDICYHRNPEDIEKLNAAQYNLLKTAHRLLKQDGELVYCTCSLQKEEGEEMIDRVNNLFERMPIKSPVLQPYLTPQGDIRTFPYNGMDGFFIAHLKKRCK